MTVVFLYRNDSSQKTTEYYKVPGKFVDRKSNGHFRIVMQGKIASKLKATVPLNVNPSDM
jgi:hypothetical protein